MKMKSFKPIKQEKVVISIRIDIDTLEKIDSNASEYNLSRNEFIVQCIDYALENIEIK